MRILVDLNLPAAWSSAPDRVPPVLRLAGAFVRAAADDEVWVLVDARNAVSARAWLSRWLPAARVLGRALPGDAARAAVGASARQADLLRALVHEDAVAMFRPDALWLCGWDAEGGGGDLGEGTAGGSTVTGSGQDADDGSKAAFNGQGTCSTAQWRGALDPALPAVVSVLPDAIHALEHSSSHVQPALQALRLARCVLAHSEPAAARCAALATPMRPRVRVLPALPGEGDGYDADWDALGRAVRAAVDEVLVDAGVLAELPPEHAPTQAAGAGPVTAPAALRPGARSGRRPRLALVTPLPPERTGIAAYVAELLPFLALWYEIHLIVEQTEVDGLLPDLPVRSHDWFDRNAALFDRVLYQMGNSRFHVGMIALMQRHPGVVVLHDFVLSDLLEHLDRSGHSPGVFTRELHRSHGYPALRLAARDGAAAAVRAAACSRWVFDAALGVILHSHHAASRAAAEYGPGLDCAVVRMPRTLPAAIDRAGARRRLGLADDAFVVCAFGVLAASKLNHRLLACWQGSTLVADPACTLVFVGEAAERDYGEHLAAAAAAPASSPVSASASASARDSASAPRSPARVRFTGYADAAAYADWLAAADVAVQLRAQTRGETSRAIVDCLAHGLATVVNAHGPVAELPADAVQMLEDLFDDAALVDALQRLRSDPAARAALAGRGRRFARECCDPQRVVAEQVAAIERFHRAGRRAAARASAEAIAATCAPLRPSEQWLGELAGVLAGNDAGAGPRQLLIDVTALALHDLRSGIQRVVRAVLNVLLDRPLPGWRVEPVYLAHGRYRHARRFTAALVGAPVDALSDDIVDARCGDVFLGLDLVTHGVHLAEQTFVQWRARGVSVQFVVYDLLPVQLPAHFPEEDAAHYRHWLDTVMQVSDRLVCISAATAQAVRERLPASHAPAPEVAWFHLGADLPASLPSHGLGPQDDALLTRLTGRPALLMVGTVEPRKGHAQALDAFETLLRRGVELDLVIVGRPGWMVGPLVERLRVHPEAGRRLHWLEGASDETLTRLYAACTGLLMASEGEGFGLPLIEAAQHRLPILARDLPVFREVAGDHAAYFDAADGAGLADAIAHWLALRGQGAAPDSAGLRWITWEQSTQALLGAVLGDDPTWASSVGLHS